MDRQDIDALLIGALYGELTPADEARLAAHLETHPADRTALDDLKSARESVRESRIFELQIEPPQAISALLLQEAAPPRAASAPSRPRASAVVVPPLRAVVRRPSRDGRGRDARRRARRRRHALHEEGRSVRREDRGSRRSKSPSSTTRADNTAAPGPVGRRRCRRRRVRQGRGRDRRPPAPPPTTWASPSASSSTSPRKPSRRRRDRAKVAATELGRGRLETKKQAVAHSAASKKGYIEVTTPQRMPKEMPPANADKRDDGDCVREGSGRQHERHRGRRRRRCDARRRWRRCARRRARNGDGARLRLRLRPPTTRTRRQADRACRDGSSADGEQGARAGTAAGSSGRGSSRAPTALIGWAKAQHAEAVARVRRRLCGSRTDRGRRTQSRVRLLHAEHAERSRAQGLLLVHRRRGEQGRGAREQTESGQARERRSAGRDDQQVSETTMRVKTLASLAVRESGKPSV